MTAAMSATREAEAANGGTPAGLSEAEARARLASEGGNVVPDEGGRSWWDIVRRNLFTFINITLLVVGRRAGAMGAPRDALLASGSGARQRLRRRHPGDARQAPARPDRLAQPRPRRPSCATVRSGRSTRSRSCAATCCASAPATRSLPTATVVGDSALEMDESLLTGESDPVSKHSGDPVSSGSFCISGIGLVPGRTRRRRQHGGDDDRRRPRLPRATDPAADTGQPDRAAAARGGDILPRHRACSAR